MSKKLLYGVVVFITGVYLLYYGLPCDCGPKLFMVPNETTKYMHDSQDRAIPYDQSMDIIFIGGMPRSGTTLMRALLDAHPEVRCGEETHVIPRILDLWREWETSPSEKERLTEAGIAGDVLDSAIRSFILEIIVKHGKAAPHLCNKDPFTLNAAFYLSQIIPHSRYVFMIRDGRAVVHSIITRNVIIVGFDNTSYRQCLQKWNEAVESMCGQCLRVGPYRCMPVYYEQLVLHPELWMRRILGFLNIAWNDSVLHHEDYVGKPGGISLSKSELSTDQVIKPVNLEALSKWVGNIPEDVVRDMGTIAPMLQTLGYDPEANPPNYGEPDSQIVENTLHLQENKDIWNQGEKDIFE